MNGSRLRTTPSMPDLRPRPDAKIEWWFVQGRIDKGVEAPLHFMVAFFQVHRNADRGSVGHMLLANAIDDTGAQHLVRSDISPEIVPAHRDVAAHIIASRFSPALGSRVLRRHMEESEKLRRANGPRLVHTPASLARDELAIAWDGFALCRRDDQLRLRLSSGGGRTGGLAADLALKPKRVWLEATGATLSPGRPQPYTYRSCPRAELVGTLDGHQVSGTAWIDRQWSNTFDNWFFGEDEKRLQVLGWDWLGVSLDNGADIMAHQRTVDNGRPDGESRFVVFVDDRAELHRGLFERSYQDDWTSPRSGTAYPITRRLVVPAFAVDLRVEPIAKDQEVAVFGAPAIWEGAVRVSGRFDGRIVEGHGRLELFGYGYAETLRRLLARKARRALMSIAHLPRRTDAGERDAV